MTSNLFSFDRAEEECPSIILKVNLTEVAQKPGRGRILTDTPEKEEIKKHAIKIAKKKKKKLVKTPEFEIKANSSKE
ncbi:hypothetical protein TNCV_3047651 [Trichonephila clavipes]|nr:hypothetical protein TNCV_3047651 [Trichonephila clavipes]